MRNARSNQYQRTLIHFQKMQNNREMNLKNVLDVGSVIVFGVGDSIESVRITRRAIIHRKDKEINYAFADSASSFRYHFT